MGVEQGEIELRLRLVGTFLKDRRVQAGYTQIQVARALKYSSAQFVSNWERGISLPPLDVLPKLAGLYAIPAGEMIDVMHKYQEQVIKLQKRQLSAVFGK